MELETSVLFYVEHPPFLSNNPSQNSNLPNGLNAVRATKQSQQELIQNHFTIYVKQIITLYAFNLYNDMCQLFVNKTREKRKKNLKPKMFS